MKKILLSIALIISFVTTYAQTSNLNEIKTSLEDALLNNVSGGRSLSQVYTAIGNSANQFVAIAKFTNGGEAFTTTGTGGALQVDYAKYFSLQVNPDVLGNTVTTYSIDIQGSMDGVFWSPIKNTTQADGLTTIVSTTTPINVLFVRVRINTLTLGTAAGVTVWITATN